VEVVVGRIGRPHGLRGEVTVEVRTDDPDERFAPGRSLRTDPPRPAPLTVAAGRVHGGRLLVTFDGVADRSAAERLHGLLLVADVDPDERLDDPDEFFDHQLLGLAVRTVTGVQVGEVAEMLHLPGQDLIAVRRSDGGEVLVPFVGQFVPTIDLESGVIVVDPPAGLLDEGDPGSTEVG
jgi:16S rRNA processing protein RimM